MVDEWPVTALAGLGSLRTSLKAMILQHSLTVMCFFPGCPCTPAAASASCLGRARCRARDLAALVSAGMLGGTAVRLFLPALQ